MSKYNVTFYGVEFKDGSRRTSVTVPITQDDYNSLIGSDRELFERTFDKVQASVEKIFGSAIAFVSDWDVKP